MNGDRLLALHRAREILVLVNVWDAASARTVAALPGCAAIATASWAIAAGHGVADGELGVDAMLAAVTRIVAAVELPVTADLESGYGDVGETVRRAIAAGVVGANLEDEGRPLAEAVAGVREARAAAEAEGFAFVLNARTDLADPEEVLRRGHAFAEAGADCFFPLHAIGPDEIARLTADVPLPLSILLRPGGPTVAELEALGVARVSFGPGPLGIALAALDRAARDLISGGAPPPELGFRPGG